MDSMSTNDQLMFGLMLILVLLFLTNIAAVYETRRRIKVEPPKPIGKIAVLKISHQLPNGDWTNRYIFVSRQEPDFLSVAKYEYVSGAMSIVGRIGIEYDNGMVFMEGENKFFNV